MKISKVNQVIANRAKWLVCLYFAAIVSVLNSGFCEEVQLPSLNKQILSWSNNQASIRFTVPKGYSVYAHDTSMGLPLTFHLVESTNVKNYVIEWPVPQKKTEGAFNGRIYKDCFDIKIIFDPKMAERAVSSLVSFDGALCSDTRCIPFSTSIKIGEEASFLYGWLTMFLLALVGGFILNLMPCVWPILLLKLQILGKEETQQRRQKSLLTLLGIIFFFNMLMIFGWLMQPSGQQPALWGQHFNNPYFLLALTCFIIVSALFYVFPVMFFSVLQTLVGKWIINKTSGRIQDFMLGFFAGILASPCTAPFLSGVLAFSLMQQPWVMWLILNLVAVGYGIPYIFIAIIPGFLRYLPEPGKWMKWVEKIAGGALAFFAAWMIFITYESFKHETTEEKEIFYENRYHFPVKPLVVDEINNSLKRGKKVFVITSAPWCLTCLYNEKTTFENPKIVKALSSSQVVVMLGIWKKDNSTERYLRSIGAPGIPTYRIYTAAKPEGINLGEILSVHDILQGLEVF